MKPEVMPIIRDGKKGGAFEGAWEARGKPGEGSIPEAQES